MCQCIGGGVEAEINGKIVEGFLKRSTRTRTSLYLYLLSWSFTKDHVAVQFQARFFYGLRSELINDDLLI